MSVRIHAIAKETNKTSKEVIEILVERGYDVKSASSTIDNITAQSLIEELTKEQEVEAVSKVAPDSNVERTEISSSDLPFVKTKEDLDREREEKEKAEQIEKDAQSASLNKEVSTEVRAETVEEKSVAIQQTAGAAPSLPPPPSKSAGVPPLPPAKPIQSSAHQPDIKTVSDDSAGIVAVAGQGIARIPGGQGEWSRA